MCYKRNQEQKKPDIKILLLELIFVGVEIVCIENYWHVNVKMDTGKAVGFQEEHLCIEESQGKSHFKGNRLLGQFFDLKQTGKSGATKMHNVQVIKARLLQNGPFWLCRAKHGKYWIETFSWWQKKHYMIFCSYFLCHKHVTSHITWPISILLGETCSIFCYFGQIIY